MRFLMIPVLVLAVILQKTTAKGYGAGGNRMVGGALNGGLLYGKAKPTPYTMGYEAPDEQGNVNFRQEEGDGNGNVRGSYGYKDSQGLYRIVQYTAGAAGYRAVVKTNEPGTDGKESPADVQMMVEQTPYGIQEQYNRRSGAYTLSGSIRESSSGEYNPSFGGVKSDKSGY